MKRLPILLAAAVVTCAALGQNATPNTPQDAGDKPLSQDDLLKQLETFTPLQNQLAVTTAPVNGTNPAAPGLASITPGTPGGTIIGPGTTPDSGEAKPKGPTIIDAQEATFDQRANVAVFVGTVVVKDPEFNVWCDKLTAYLKHEDTDKPGKNAKVTPKPATPKPATPKADGTTAKATPAPRGGGLDHAIAVCTEGHRVKITQDKLDADTGKIKHGIGFSDWATYDANTGDVVMYGSPDVTQENDRCVATAPYTVMTLNRDGHMTAKGPHRTFIIDDSTPKTDDGTHPATPHPASTPDSGSRSAQ
ncbi:MAG TPA: LptA/OstA family protein [Chthoniobacter sp.]|jgi:lipopolysaccharide export system protein LptA